MSGMMGGSRDAANKSF